MRPQQYSDAPGSAEPAEPAVIAGRYEVQAVVGRGGMGAVYRVRDQRTGRELALKRLRVRARRKNDALALFEREFQTLSELRHPRIIDVYDYGVDAQGSYYTMELLRGADMRELAPLHWQVACEYLREVATSLALLHARKLVHRDVTPQNVRVGTDGHCKLIDFGALADYGTTGEVIGTPPCVPPEAIDGRPIDQRVDLYALGCLGYFLLTGRHAYPATDSRQLRTFWARAPEPPSRAARTSGDAAVSATLPEVPAALDALVMSLIALDPMARPSSASAVIDRLDVILDGAVLEEQQLAESYLASAPLCGRKTELARIKLALEQALRGRGTSLFVSGPAGVGRTRLLAEIALRAKLQGCVTLQVDASEHEGPYGALLALVSELVFLLPGPATKAVAELAQRNPSQAAAFGRLAPELNERLGRPPAGRATEDADREPTRERALSLAALHALIAGVAREQALALLVDDVHRADEASLGVLGTLAREARHLKLVVAVAQRAGDEALCASGLSALAQPGRMLELAPLRERQLLEWMSAVFGDAPNLGRLVSFLHERTRGRPSSIAALLRFLVAQGELRHRDGAWVLPNEPAQMQLPDDAEDTALARLDAEGGQVRALAEALSMHRGVLTLPLCAAIRDGQPEAEACGATLGLAELEAQLETLVHCEVITPGRTGYRFCSERLRERLSARVEGARRTALHLRMGEAILARGAKTPLEQLAAGVHLLEAHDPRGLALASDAAAAFADRIDGIAGAVRLLERAYALACEANAPPARKLALLSPLGLGGYAVDHRLARYTDDVLDLLDRVSGLALTRKLADYGGKLGKWGYACGAWLGLTIGMVLFHLGPRRDRPPSYVTAVRWGVGPIVALAGRAAICLDKPACDRLVDRIAPLRMLGLHASGGFAVAYCRALASSTEDRYTETRERWLRLQRAIDSKRIRAEVPAEQLRLWTGGVSYALGLFESFRGDPAVLERAATLEASGTDMHAMIAAQLRLQYHGFRGEAEEVRKSYERMESCAIQTGSSWQVETWSAISINLFAALWHDVIIAKRAMRETQRMKDELPSLERYAITSEATYLLRRGQPRECADLYEPLLANEPPLTRVGWCTASGLLAEAYNQLGQHQQAKALCERVLAQVASEDRVYFAMRMEVDIAYAVALAALGEPDRAVRHLHELRECYAHYGSPVALGSVHEALARIEFGRGDRKRFTEHLKQVEAHFTKLGNPALIARFQALSDIAGEGGGIVSRVAVMREVRAFEASLESISDPSEGARAILGWLMKSCEGYDGYLFGAPELDGEDPVLLAATSEREPGSDVFEAVGSALRSLGKKGDSTQCGTGAASNTNRDGRSSHLYLLSYQEADDFHAEGALVLLGRAPYAPPVRYELLQAAGQQLRRLIGGSAA